MPHPYVVSLVHAMDKYILSASVFGANEAMPYSIKKIFTKTSLENTTVAELTRMLVEKIVPNCIKLLCGNHHSVIRYGDDTETEVLVDENDDGTKKALVHHMSLCLPLDDARFNGGAGFLHPDDLVFDHLHLARKSCNVIHVTIFKNGLIHKKAGKRTTLLMQTIEEGSYITETNCKDAIVIPESPIAITKKTVNSSQPDDNSTIYELSSFTGEEK